MREGRIGPIGDPYEESWSFSAGPKRPPAPGVPDFPPGENSSIWDFWAETAFKYRRFSAGSGGVPATQGGKKRSGLEPAGGQLPPMGRGERGPTLSAQGAADTPWRNLENHLLPSKYD